MVCTSDMVALSTVSEVIMSGFWILFVLFCVSFALDKDTYTTVQLSLAAP